MKDVEFDEQLDFLLFMVNTFQRDYGNEVNFGKEQTIIEHSAKKLHNLWKHRVNERIFIPSNNLKLLVNLLNSVNDNEDYLYIIPLGMKDEVMCIKRAI